ncbi:hypothetical protein K1T71_006205 [Dendrolimus kikuchii]|uniref:Uncharacterized protein n=1 Tax=Dendrolimus kikuchii TaxID=765133 RepID=A0ACC1D3G9_9NEOP|nr:hypothetical protein K1T71_006205 [Dendrolimus kikuchii]
MNEENERSVLVNISKPRVYSKVPLYTSKKTIRLKDKTLRKPSEASLTKYTLYSTKPLPVRTIKKEELLIPYKLFNKKQDKKNHELRLTINIYEKYKIAYTELRSRLNVDDPEDDIYTVTDIDKDFYRSIEVHRLSRYAPLFKSIKSLFDQYLTLRQNIGYINDYIINIEVLQRKEREIYDRSVKKYMEQLKYLDEFISLDYKKSIACLNECDKLASQVNKKETELQNLATQRFTIVSRLIGLDYFYGLQQKYGRFLYYLSPPSWRSKHRDFARSVEIEARGFDFSCSSEEDTFNVIFEKMKNECCSGLIKPVIYFKKPSDLIDVFDGIEKQQLYHFSHLTQVEPHTKTLRKSINSLKENIVQETAAVNNIIKFFKTSLQFYNDRGFQLEAKFFKILHGIFYQTTAVADVLKLKLHLEFGYERVFSEKPFKIDTMTTAKALEKMYFDFAKKLDDIQNDKVKSAIVQYMDMERNKIKRAKIATRELLLFKRLQRDLLRAHAFIVKETADNKEQKVDKSSVKRKQSTRYYSKAKIDGGNQKELTEAEREYLALFTDWTENDDPTDYLQSFSISRERNSNT